MKKPALIMAVLAAGMSTCAHAQPPSVPVIQAPTVAQTPKIDGVLDDECWKSAAKFGGFINTALGTPATQPTDVWLCRDADNLYIAFHCHDSHPELIRARQRRRNGDQSCDDRVTVNIDTQHTHQTCYIFKVNPLGTQTESIPSGTAGNITWRGDWNAAGKMVADGWVCEIAIPFQLLRYPDSADIFGITFTRTVVRTDENTAWPDISPNYSYLKSAISPAWRSNPVPGGRFSCRYLVSSREPGRRFDDVGLDYKQELTSDSVATLTYNPDFSDVQDSVASIDYTYTERYLSDQRPFFQEGAKLFPDSTVFYSRRVGDMNWGAKVFGDRGGNSFAALAAIKQGEESHMASAYSYNRESGNTSSGVKLYFSRSVIEDAFRTEPDSPYASSCVSPGFFWQSEDSGGSTYIGARQISSINTGRPNASSFSFSLERDSAPGRLGGGFGYYDVDSDFYVRDGYTSTTGIRGPSAGLYYYDKIERSRISDFSSSIRTSRYRSSDGSVHDESVSMKASITTTDEWWLGGTIRDGEWLGLRDSSHELHLSWLERHLYTGGGVDLISGKRSGQDYRYMAIHQGYEITSVFNVSGAWEWSRLGTGADQDRQSQFTISGNWDIGRERNLAIWVVGRDSNLNLCFTFKKTVRSGSEHVLYLRLPQLAVNPASAGDEAGDADSVVGGC